MSIRVIPVVEYRNCHVSLRVEGFTGTLYGQTKCHPNGGQSQVYPHPDQFPEEALQKWFSAWEVARFDLFEPFRGHNPCGVDFIVQEQQDGKWVTLQSVNGVYEVQSAAPVIARRRGRPRKTPLARKAAPNSAAA